MGGRHEFGFGGLFKTPVLGNRTALWKTSFLQTPEIYPTYYSLSERFHFLRIGQQSSQKATSKYSLQSRALWP
jgi:hypothetical protein